VQRVSGRVHIGVLKQPVPSSPASSAPTAREGTLSSVVSAPTYSLSHDYPEESPDTINLCVCFPVRWGQIWKGSTHVPKDCIGWRVVNKHHLQGSSKRLGIYNYNADLLYQERSGSYRRVGPAGLCHEQGKRDCAKYSDSMHHISTHLRKSHLMSIPTGVIPEPLKPNNPWEAAEVAAGQITPSRSRTGRKMSC
jgi:hypothetical protein